MRTKSNQRLKSVLELTSDATARPAAEDWLRLEQSLRMSIPKDYKDFIQTYGEGVIDDFLWPLCPNHSNQNLDFVRQVGRQADVLRTIREAAAPDVPFPVFPEPDGLMIWGLSDNGDTLHWLTAGSAEEWPTVVFESRGPRWVRYDLAATELIFGLVTKQIRHPLFPSDFPSEHPSFRSQ